MCSTAELKLNLLSENEEILEDDSCSPLPLQSSPAISMTLDNYDICYLIRLLRVIHELRYDPFFSIILAIGILLLASILLIVTRLGWAISQA